MNIAPIRGFSRVVVCAFVLALSACSQESVPQGSDTAARTDKLPAAPHPEPAKITLRRAYVGSNVTEGGHLDEAKAEFAIGEEVYVGALLSAKPSAGQRIEVVAETFDGEGNSVATGQSTIEDADRATIRLVPVASKLASGAYVVVVKLNDVPNWQVKFNVK